MLQYEYEYEYEYYITPNAINLKIGRLIPNPVGHIQFTDLYLKIKRFKSQKVQMLMHNMNSSISF